MLPIFLKSYLMDSPTPSEKPKKKRLSIDEAKALLWSAGEIDQFILKGVQKEIFKEASDFSKTLSIILCSRQLGKTTALHVLAVKTCIQNPGCIVKYATPKQNMIRKITKTAMRTILESCPKHLQPEFNTQEKTWVFPNGSEIQLAGTDAGNAENLRGSTALLCIVDEAGFCDDLEYVVNGILFPTTTTTNGKIVLASTPNFNEPAHDFHEKFVIPLQAEGRVVKYTIDESPLLSETQIKRIESRYPGGRTNLQFRCEYLCELVKSSESMVIPEFLEKESIIVTDKIDLPYTYDAYVSMDIGFKDLTVALFAVYDFRNAMVYILDELVMFGPSMTTSVLAARLADKEKENFVDAQGDYVGTYMRIADNDLKLINDLYQQHGLLFFPTKKDHKEGAINNARIWIQETRIRIHPRCKTLIYHLKTAQWNKNRTDFLRIRDNEASGLLGGHADGISALFYLIRNVQTGKKPSGLITYEHTILGQDQKKSTLSNNLKALSQIFKTKK